VETISIIRAEDQAAWDHFAFQCPGAGYTHLFNWSHVIREVYHHQPLYLAAMTPPEPGSDEKQRVRGIFPLFKFKTMSGKTRLVSIPFFDQAGMLGENNEIEAMLFSAAVKTLAESGAGDLEIRRDSPCDFPCTRSAEKLRSAVSTLKVSLRRRLPATREEMMQNFKSKLRSQIRKGINNGLRATTGKQELVEPFYDVFSRNMRDLGSPVHSKKLFYRIFKYFYKDAFISVVTSRSRPVAAGFLIRYKDSISNPWSSSLREFRHLNANMVLYWEMMGFACSRGLDFFDMGRSSAGASTYWFKKQWEPEEKPLYWHYWCPEGRKNGIRTESLSIRPWTILPLPLANAIGPLVRRHISL